MALNLILIFISIALGLIGQIFMKYGAMSGGQIDFSHPLTFIISTLTNIQTLAGLFFYFISSIFWIIILSRVELSFAYPLLSIGYVAILFISALLFKEKILPIHYGGVLLIITGVILITRNR